MTATDELRKLLEEHGIKHFDYDKGGRTQTQWAAPDGTRYFTYETYDNPSKTAKLVISWFPTPEQAIAATLGSHERTCKPTDYYDRDCGFTRKAGDYDEYWGAFCACSECGRYVPMINYCPKCGARFERSDYGRN